MGKRSRWLRLYCFQIYWY